ncbi:MAG: DUF6265 family protein [Acidobacteriota bacterium]
MTPHFLVAVSLLAATLFTADASAQTPNSEHTLRLDADASSPAASIDDVAWLGGYWRGEGLGGHVEELWGAPIGDRMVGSFTFSKGGGLVFAETMMLVEEGGSLVLKIKHFNPDFSGWEEKDDFVSFPLVRVGTSEVFFSGLTFRRTGDALEAYVVAGGENGRQELAFQFKRTGWD